MSVLTIEKKIYYIENNNMVNIAIAIPYYGEEASEKNSEFVTDMMIAQIERGMKEVIAAYKNSALPDLFLNGQNFIVTTEMPALVYGEYYYPSDDIFLDPDALSNVRNVEASYLFGHEMGHKISFYRDIREAYLAIARLFDISLFDSQNFISEIYADACGNIVAGTNYFHQGLEVDDEICEHINRLVLKSAHKI